MKKIVLYIIVSIQITGCTSIKKPSSFKEEVAIKANDLYKTTHCNWTGKNFGEIKLCDDGVTVYGYPDKCYKVFFKNSKGNAYIRVGENSNKEIGVGYLYHINNEMAKKLKGRFAFCYN